MKALKAAITAKKKRPLIAQGPERHDGAGARAFAIINVMVLAEALGFEFVYQPISGSVPVFGPTALKGAIDWGRRMLMLHFLHSFSFTFVQRNGSTLGLGFRKRAKSAAQSIFNA